MRDNGTARRAALLAGMFLLGHVQAAARRIEVIASTSTGARLQTQAPLSWQPAAARNTPVITVEENQRRQLIRGFGATFNEAGLISLNHLPPAAQEETLRRLFDVNKGAGFSMMSAPIAACDFASAGPWYSYADTPGDVEMKHFTIQRDLGPNGLITYIRRARRHGRFQLQTTNDYPPDWMMDEKTNVLPQYYPALARYYVRYVQEYARAGVKVDYLSPFNEPWYVYAKITWPEIARFLREHLIPAFQQAKLATRLQPSDTDKRRVALEVFPPIMRDPFLRRHLHSYPFHGYQWDRDGVAPLAKLRELEPELELWQTEVCHMKRTTEGGKRVPLADFSDGDWWGRMIVADLRIGVSVWLYWNMILDETGGPWMVDLKHSNEDNNYQHPVVIIDRTKREAVYTGLYYYLAHFSRYVRPGAVRLETQGAPAPLHHVAFQNADGRKVLVVVNSADAATRFTIRAQGRDAETELPARSVATYRWR
jgi:glucosylceramidase